jgi:hypothetical protein
MIAGMLLGVLLFAVTENPAWIALGPAFGLAIGPIIASGNRPV